MAITGVSFFDLPRNKCAQYLDEEHIGEPGHDDLRTRDFRRQLGSEELQRLIKPGNSVALFKADMDKFRKSREKEVGRPTLEREVTRDDRRHFAAAVVPRRPGLGHLVIFLQC